jgi:hypothetical protein
MIAVIPCSCHTNTRPHCGQADQARTDFALIEDQLEFIMGQLARVPTRGDLAKAALGIIFRTAIFTTLFVCFMWH